MLACLLLLCSADRPNVVILMADDLGWGDVGFNADGSFDRLPIRTPYLDRLAAEGAVLTRFYAAAPVCSPTRGSMLTGRHPLRYGISNANAGHLPRAETTIHEVAKDAGYRTGHFGKWHLGTLTTEFRDSNRGGPGGAKHYSPPTWHGVDAWLATEAKVPTFDPMLRPADAKDGFGGSLKLGWLPVAGGDAKPYGTRYFTGGGAAESNPVPADDPSLGGDDSAIVVSAALRFAAAGERPYVMTVWFHAPHLPVVAADDLRQTYAGLSDYEASYAACVTALDEQVGRLREAVGEDAVIIFTSDNGPEGNARAPGSAGPFRGRKRDLLEGGVRVPTVVRWPGVTTPGSRIDVPMSTSDLLPTLAAALGGTPSEITLDGVDVRPVLSGKSTDRRPIGFAFKKQAAWHEGPLKIWSRDGGDTWSLYDLSADAGETNDLSADRPDDVGRMSSAWRTWRDSL